MSKTISILTVIVVIATSCTSSNKRNELAKFPLEFVNIWRNGNPIDTIYKQMNSIEFKDSIYYLSYFEVEFDGDTTEQTYELPISNSKQTFKHLKDTSVYRLTYEGLRYFRYDKEYIVYKYLYDSPSSDDEETNYYFIPEFGIVIIRSRAWGSYSRMISNSSSSDFDKIFYLTEKTVEDFTGFYFPSKK